MFNTPKRLQTKFIWRLYDFGKITKSDMETFIGEKIFKYPKCCVENFIKLDGLGIKNIAEYMNNQIEADTNGFKYVLCLNCRNKLKEK